MKNDDDKLPSIHRIENENDPQLAVNDEVQARLQKAVNIGGGSQVKYAREAALINQLITIDEPTDEQKQRLIQAYANVGEYQKAYELSGDKIYQQLADALSGQTAKCKCAPTKTVVLEQGRPKEVSFSPHFIRQQAFDRNARQFKDIVMCNKCHRVFVNNE